MSCERMPKSLLFPWDRLVLVTLARVLSIKRTVVGQPAASQLPVLGFRASLSHTSVGIGGTGNNHSY